LIAKRGLINLSSLGPFEVQLPEEIKKRGVTRVAAEHGTLGINYNDKVIRSTFYANDINQTIRGFSWLVLIGISNPAGKST